MTYNELIQNLINAGITPSDLAFGNWIPADTTEIKDLYKIYRNKNESEKERFVALDKLRGLQKKQLDDFLKEHNIPHFECVEEVGGEGQGEHWHIVYYFREIDIYIKITGYYQSYDGVSIDSSYDYSCREVRPKDKIIVVYE